MVRRNPVLRAGEMYDGDVVVSESRELHAIKALLESAVRALHYAPTPAQIRSAARDLEAAHTKVCALHVQSGRGVHVNPSHRVNPALVIYGNPGARRGGEVCLSKGQLQAIVYTHERDGSDRVHGFANAEITLSNDREGALVIDGLEQETDVSMYGSADKKQIVIRGDHGQPLWDYFPDEA